MSARDKVLSLFGVELSHLNQANRSVLEDAADEILREHAHELAEAIRQETETHQPGDAYMDGWIAGSKSAADLIDPEVEK